MPSELPPSYVVWGSRARSRPRVGFGEGSSIERLREEEGEARRLGWSGRGMGGRNGAIGRWWRNGWCFGVFGRVERNGVRCGGSFYWTSRHFFRFLFFSAWSRLFLNNKKPVRPSFSPLGLVFFFVWSRLGLSLLGVPSYH